MFAPWQATKDELYTARRDALDHGVANDVIDRMCAQWNAAQIVKEARSAIEGGDGLALMNAVNECLSNGLVAPDWLAKEFRQRYNAVAERHVKSWDDEKALGRPLQKGRHLESAREKMRLSLPVYGLVRELQAQGEPIDESLFERIGEQLDISPATAKEYYYSVRKELESFFEVYRQRSGRAMT
ncbi:MAG TPA: hypothetical protein VIV61_04690 [Candidatus Ozemobacteraceae bacterium]